MSQLIECLQSPAKARSKVCRIPGSKYQSYEEFVLAHGQEFRVQELPAGVRLGTIKQCFENAAKLALSDENYRYVEGYADCGLMPIHHAWCIDTDGNVIDNTWREIGAKYFGVHFARKYLSHVIILNEQYGILDNYQQRHPLLTGAHIYLGDGRVLVKHHGEK